MSWSSYISNLEQQQIGRCCIHGRDDCNPWAQSENFKLGPDEVLKVRKIIEANDDSVYGSGVELGGFKWTVIFMDKDELVLKGKGDCSKMTLVICLTGKTVLIGGNTDENISAPAVRTAVENMGQHLKDASY